ncbi:hypothetical protein [Nodosilinea sp. P-1105]|uniref:hypothetical protein n=1 Tax=Nodosilinea sp. P-1105 TaxID=2546229 RepID=UPI00146F5761|nr:hypothetical protein [Nodosilinea sp. P-1105]NMF82553.1 hypothetical protein [Nodosilinea sp. P-1105]
MKLSSYLARVMLGALVLSTLVMASAEARPGGGRGQRPQGRAPRPEVMPEVVVDAETPDTSEATGPEGEPDTAAVVVDPAEPTSEAQGLPPGLQRRVDSGRGLPPGLQRRVESGRGLPPGLQR